MRTSAFVVAAALASLTAACAGGDHKHARAWTQEELDALEQKWGHEVSLS
jgi:hypothetical protein